MACTLGYIQDVEQFARLGQLKHAIEEVQPFMEDTTNFIVEFTSDGEGVSAFLCTSTVVNCNVAIVTALRLPLSSRTQAKIDELTKRFARFKQQFDRGVAVQSAATLETLLEDMGTYCHLLFKVNH
jgi:hypothetical protein